MNSTSVGLVGLNAHTPSLLVMVSLSLSLIAFVFFRFLDKRNIGAIVNLLGGLVMIPVIISLSTEFGVWPQAYVFRLLLCFVLCIPTYQVFKRIKEQAGTRRV